MAPLYGDDTPDSVKNAKGLHLVTQSTPNGQKVQILLEELKQVYGTEWDTTLIVWGFGAAYMSVLRADKPWNRTS
jgi:hypothetical protein